LRYFASISPNFFISKYIQQAQKLTTETTTMTTITTTTTTTTKTKTKT
jgi:hypothetical protein